MRPTGIIFAALDCDSAVIEAWNRWYDLEHTPPNLLLEGVIQSRRYVAPPQLHAARVAATGSGYADGRATFITIYWLTGSPRAAFDGMTKLREQLVAQGRMAFPDDKKVVHEGGVYETVDALGAPETRLVPDDAPFVGHTGVIVVQRRGDRASGRIRARAAIDTPGVNGVWTLGSLLQPETEVDLLFVEGDPAAIAEAVRGRHPHGVEVDVVVDAPYELIEPLRYPFADAIRSSSLPPTVAS